MFQSWSIAHRIIFYLVKMTDSIFFNLYSDKDGVISINWIRNIVKER